MKFTPEDFIGKHASHLWSGDIDISIAHAEAIAHVANTKLEEWLSKADTVYSPSVGTVEQHIWSNRKALGSDHAHSNDTHKAKLVCVEKIK